MATVNGLTAERMLDIEAASIVDGAVDGSGNLILTNHGGDDINAGYVRGPAGPAASNVRPSGLIVGNNTASENVASGTWTQIASFMQTGGASWKQGNAYQVTGGRIQMVESGIYVVRAGGTFSGNSTNRRGCNIDANASATAAYANAFHDLTTFNSTAVCYVSVDKAAFRINAGEYLRFWMYQDSGSVLTASHGSGNLYVELTKISDLP